MARWGACYCLEDTKWAKWPFLTRVQLGRGCMTGTEQAEEGEEQEQEQEQGKEQKEQEKDEDGKGERPRWEL